VTAPREAAPEDNIMATGRGCVDNDRKRVGEGKNKGKRPSLQMVDKLGQGNQENSLRGGSRVPRFNQRDVGKS